MIPIKSIWESQQPTGEIIIKTKIDTLPHLNCYAATNHITGNRLYIMSVPKSVAIPPLKSNRFRGLLIFYNELAETFELHICLLDNNLKDIFSLFIQNILDDISAQMTENEAFTKTLHVIAKWKILFDKIGFNGLSIEQQKGLMGELLFMNFLLDKEKSIKNVLNAWTGADFEAKDFVFGSVGIEIKLTSSKHPKLQIINERQLDTQNFTALFLVLYAVEEVKKNGFRLDKLVERTQEKIGNDIDALKNFNEKLKKVGYLKSDSNHYTKLYALRNTYSFYVDAAFPKIVKKQLPLGIYNTSYCIELSAVEKFSIAIEEITPKL
jgi:hypothetical protein